MYAGPVWHTYTIGCDIKSADGIHTNLFWHVYRALLACTSGSCGMHTCPVRQQLLHRHPELKYVQPALPLSVEKFPQEVHIIGGKRVRRVDPRKEVPTKRRERAALNHAPVRRVAAVRPEALLDAVVRGHLREARVVKPGRGVAGRLEVIKGRSWPARLRLADAVEPVRDAAEEVERLAPPRRHRGAQQGRSPSGAALLPILSLSPARCPHRTWRSALCLSSARGFLLALPLPSSPRHPTRTHRPARRRGREIIGEVRRALASHHRIGGFPPAPLRTSPPAGMPDMSGEPRGTSGAEVTQQRLQQAGWERARDVAAYPVHVASQKIQ